MVIGSKADPNAQLKNGGVLTDVDSSSMSGTRVSGFKTSVLDAKKSAKSCARPPVSGELGSLRHSTVSL